MAPLSHDRVWNPNVGDVRILIATTGVLPAAPVAELCNQLSAEEGQVTVMTVIRVPRSFLDELDDDVRRSFLDNSPPESSDAEQKAARYLEERGQRKVEPIVAALQASGFEPSVKYVEADDPAEAIISTAELVQAELVMMGATRRLFTEEAWRSVSARVMDKSHLPVLLVPGTRIEDTQEMMIIEA
jgi:nucleotide-binding universal stress UspA family protein